MSESTHFDAGNGVEPIEFRDLEQFFKIVVTLSDFDRVLHRRFIAAGDDAPELRARKFWISLMRFARAVLEELPVDELGKPRTSWLDVERLEPDDIARRLAKACVAKWGSK